MIGNTVSHYRVLEKLHEGGMGVVYKAEDTRLQRPVALKFLPPELTTDEEAAEGLFQEARSAASLDHPNIYTIYEIGEAEGQTFIAMAYVSGQTLLDKTLAGRMDVDEAIDIAIQIAQGLEEAHARGIIHRDIKPANVMITDRGLAKIMDFGLAKLSGFAAAQENGTAPGTLNYMSPEQIRGEEADERSDIWALGITIHEMVTGNTPFSGEYSQAVAYSILNGDPPRMASHRDDVPEALELLVAKALEKDPARRQQSASELIDELRESRYATSVAWPEGSGGARGLPSIAVLPFSNLSADEEQEYFCDGMAEEIINALTQVEGLRVVARTSSFAFKGKNDDIREIGSKLNVANLLEGSVRRLGDHLRITAQLINVADGYHIWSERYDRSIGETSCPEDIFSIQDEIALSIVGKLKVKLLERERAAITSRTPVNLEAYDMYLKGRYFWNKRTEEGYRRALRYFQQAIEHDPTYAVAYSGIADCYNLLGWYDMLPPGEAFPKSRAAAKKALEIDETLAEANASLGWLSVNRDWDWQEAERRYRRAIELNPSYASVHQWYGEFLSYMGRREESIEQMKRALDLDPLSTIINNDLGQVLYYAREYEKAIRQLRRTLELSHDFVVAHFFLALALSSSSDHASAISEARRAVELSGRNDSLMLSCLGATLSMAGEHDEAKEILDELSELSGTRFVSHFWVALIHTGRGQIDDAFESLERAFGEGDHWIETLKVHPMLDGLRTDPRFETLLIKTGLDNVSAK